MGYRSNVALVLSKDGVKFFHARLTAPTMNNDLQVCIRNFLNHANTYYVDDSTGAEVWYWEWVKWYAGDTGAYAEINFIEDTLQLLDEKDFRLIRVGEEDNDSENTGTYFDNPFNVDFVRFISIDEPAGNTGLTENR